MRRFVHWLIYALFLCPSLHAFSQDETGHEIAARLNAKDVQFRLNHISHSFDFLIRMKAQVPEGGDESEQYREGPGRVLVFRKGETQPFQTITLKNIALTLKQDGKPLVNAAALYDDQGVINAGDFNFDGLEDFAIQTGNEGSYGSPSYSVFLYDPRSTTFRLSRPLSDLILQTLGFFHLDSKNKRLITFAKDGCCYHEAVEYKVINNLPVAVVKTIEDGTIEPHFLHITHMRLANGKWQERKERVPDVPEPDQ
jgi:hypothetical protein